jgi:hypothetical protein
VAVVATAHSKLTKVWGGLRSLGLAPEIIHLSTVLQDELICLKSFMLIVPELELELFALSNSTIKRSSVEA